MENANIVKMKWYLRFYALSYIITFLNSSERKYIKLTNMLIKHPMPIDKY